tara:strand:+ start:3413 stop:3946 length:534 start_codon:yes stop_codon:yes gene_type:complete
MGRDKAMIEVEGTSLICRVATALSKAALEPIRVAVSSPEDIDAYGETIDIGIEIEWVVDGEAHAGPIEAIIEAVFDKQSDSSTIQLSPVDVPWITPELFLAIGEVLNDDDILAMPYDGAWSHPLLARIRPETIGGMLMRDKRPLHEQFTEVQHSLLMVEPGLIRNVNTPDDLQSHLP